MPLTGLLSAVLLVVSAVNVGAGSVADDGRVQGKADAPLTLIEYSDYTCGYCMKFFRETLPKLQATYIDTGKIKFVYRDYPRADRGVGVEAAVAARCAGAQGRYWAMHDRLFGEGSRLDSGSFKHAAKSLGLDQGEFGKCFDERRDAFDLPVSGNLQSSKAEEQGDERGEETKAREQSWYCIEETKRYSCFDKLVLGEEVLGGSGV